MLDQRGVVHHAGVAPADIDVGPHTVALVDVRGEVADAFVDDFALALVEGAERAFEIDLIGHDVRGAPGLHAADREHALLVVERDEPRHELRAWPRGRPSRAP